MSHCKAVSLGYTMPMHFRSLMLTATGRGDSSLAAISPAVCPHGAAVRCRQAQCLAANDCVKLAFMMMLQSVGDNLSETKLMPLLIDINVGRFGRPKVKIFDADISEFKSYQLVKPSRAVQLDGLSIKAIAEPSMIELHGRQKAGWLIRLELRWPEAACQVD
jgi:hypothetical protein